MPGMVDEPADSLDRLVERTRQALASVTDGDVVGPFVGEADEGRVRAEVAPDGRLLSVSIDPEVTRSVTAIGPLVVAAVNAALDARPGRAVDLSALAENLREVQEQSVVEMRRITQSLAGALADTVRRAGEVGDPAGRPGPR